MIKSFIPFFGEPIILWETAYDKVFIYCQIAAEKLVLLPFNTTGKRHWIKVGTPLRLMLEPPSIYQGAACRFDIADSTIRGNNERVSNSQFKVTRIIDN